MLLLLAQSIRAYSIVPILGDQGLLVGTMRYIYIYILRSEKGFYYVTTRAALERFSIECRKTKTKVITLANHKGHKHNSKPIKTRSNYM